MSTLSSPQFHSPANANPSRLAASTATSRFISLPRFPQRASHSTACRCQAASDQPEDSGGQRRSWDAVLQDAVKAAVRRWEDYVASLRSAEGKQDGGEKLEGGTESDANDVDWDWNRWKRHFEEVEEQERIVSILRAQLKDAVHKEDYKNATKLQRAIAAAVTNDAVGSAIKHLNSAIEEEQYGSAINFRDNAGTGLIGWWAGIPEDSSDPRGQIIHITAEHGKYVARSFSSRQLASGRPGFPLFEIYFTVKNNGEYIQQAVYLKKKSSNLGHPTEKILESVDSEKSGPSDDSSQDQREFNDETINTMESENDSDNPEKHDSDEIQNALEDMIPGVKVKVVKILAPGKMDRDLISKVIEQIVDDDEEDDDDDDDLEFESIETDDGSDAESDSEDLLVVDGDATIDSTEDQKSDLSVKFVISGLMQNFPVDFSPKDLVKVPAKLEKQGRFSFSITTENSEKEIGEKPHDLMEELTEPPPTVRSTNLVMSDLAKVVYKRKKIPLQVLKDVGELINLAINQDQNQPHLRGKIHFNRIDLPNTSDPLSGLYVSARGMFSSEVLYLKRKFGQWQEDDKNKKSVDLEFYEYVEALQLTGDPSVPAGQVAFRAKVGKRNQLPHKGIIPEEFGVVARYKGQGRLAEPGFQNPRWVDGELVILDGKYIRDGPVIGFVYWAPEYHFLMFFNRLKLQN